MKNDFLKNTLYYQPDYNVYFACSQCLSYALCLYLETKGLTKDDYIKGYIYNG